MWVKWTMTLVKLEGPLETRTRGFWLLGARVAACAPHTLLLPNT